VNCNFSEGKELEESEIMFADFETIAGRANLVSVIRAGRKDETNCRIVP
jgi:hypothetical protein